VSEKLNYFVDAYVGAERLVDGNIYYFGFSLSALIIEVIN